jgi:hypothetical protein
LRRYPRNRTAQLNRIVNALRDAPATERPAPPRTAFDVVDDLRRAMAALEYIRADCEADWHGDDTLRAEFERHEAARVLRVFQLVDEITALVKR